MEGFIQQLAVAYIKNGYFFYVTGRVPEGKDPQGIDLKLTERYGVEVSKWVRARRKRAGYANLQYLRYERFFILLATKGVHPFFELEGNAIRDCRRVPIKFGGYSVTHRNGHASVRIEREQLKLLESYFLELATRRSAASLGTMLGRLPFEPYAPVRRQLLGVLRSVNKARQSAGFEQVHPSCLRMRRRVVKPFESGGPGRASPEFGKSAAPPIGGGERPV